MAACTWDSTRLYQTTLSGSDLVATSSQAGLWQRVVGTAPVSSSYSGGRYFEITFSGSFTGAMVGIGRIDAPETAAYTSNKAWLWQSSGNKWHNNANSSIGTTYGVGDRIGVLLKNGRLYVRKNGTWANSGDPDAETGAIYTGLTGNMYPLVLLFDSTQAATLHCGGTITGSVPTGAYKWDNSASVTVSLVSRSGVQRASEDITWAIFDGTAPNALVAPSGTGSATLDGTGSFTASFVGTTVAPSGTATLLVSNTDGVVGNQCWSTYAPVTLTIA